MRRADNMAAAHRLSVAPMMDWTDRHCRVLHRHLSRHVRLYTEMVTTGAVLHGPVERLLAHEPVEHPLALQLGGSEPDDLFRAVEIARQWGFDEFNLNVGCPSDRVQSGTFGACLMRDPARVAACVGAMQQAAGPVPVTVKCRIGVDEQHPSVALPRFVDTVADAGVRIFIVHARKAWLQGLSPKENRTVPPLDHDLVAKLKAERPELVIVANGGIETLDGVQERYRAGLDGVMVGRAAYHNPAALLASADSALFGVEGGTVDPAQAVLAMLPYIDDALRHGERLARITRHMLGLFAGRPGARRWRRILSENAHRPAAGTDLLLQALNAVDPDGEMRGAA